MNKTILGTMFATAMLLSSTVQANDAGKQAEKALEKVGNAWTDCGIGAMIFKDLPVAAAISNVIWDLGTTAVISMAASPDTCKGVRVAAATYINESLESIETDLANGEGQYLATMFALMGLEGEKHFEARDQIRQSIANSPTYFTMSRTEKAQFMYVLIERHTA